MRRKGRGCKYLKTGHGESMNPFLPQGDEPNWVPCFLDYEMYTAQGAFAIQDGVPDCYELCPLCDYSHLSTKAWQIVADWMERQPPEVRETARVLARNWGGSWLELQMTARKLNG